MTNPDAFPSPGVVLPGNDGQPWQQGAYEGMTLRDWFAGRAMPALMDDASRAGFPPVGDAMTHISARAYAAADALLKARES